MVDGLLQLSRKTSAAKSQRWLLRLSKQTENAKRSRSRDKRNPLQDTQPHRLRPPLDRPRFPQPPAPSFLRDPRVARSTMDLRYSHAWPRINAWDLVYGRRGNGEWCGLGFGGSSCKAGLFTALGRLCSDRTVIVLFCLFLLFQHFFFLMDGS